MAVESIEVKVYCDGGFHQPTTLRFHGDRVLKSEIAAELRRKGWKVASGRVLCKEHR